MRHLRRHANAFPQRGVRVNRFADIHRICAHLDGQWPCCANSHTPIRRTKAVWRDYRNTVQTRKIPILGIFCYMGDKKYLQPSHNLAV